MNFHEFISIFPQYVLSFRPFFHSKRLVVGSLLITSSLSWYDQDWSSISPNKYIYIYNMSYPHYATILPPIYFLVNVPSHFVRPPGPYLIHDEASTPDVLAKAEAGVAPGWMVAVGFHYPSGMIIIHSYPYRGIPNHQAAILDSRDAWSI